MFTFDPTMQTFEYFMYSSSQQLEGLHVVTVIRDDNSNMHTIFSAWLPNDGEVQMTSTHCDDHQVEIYFEDLEINSPCAYHKVNLGTKSLKLATYIFESYLPMLCFERPALKTIKAQISTALASLRGE